MDGPSRLLRGVVNRHSNPTTLRFDPQEPRPGRTSTHLPSSRVDRTDLVPDPDGQTTPQRRGRDGWSNPDPVGPADKRNNESTRRPLPLYVEITPPTPSFTPFRVGTGSSSSFGYR